MRQIPVEDRNDEAIPSSDKFSSFQLVLRGAAKEPMKSVLDVV